MGFETEKSYDEIAKETESSGKYIRESGVYFGEITSAEFNKSPNGAGFLSVSIKTDEEKEANFISACIIKKDGADSFGMGFYHAMCKFTNSKATNPVKSVKTGKEGFPALYGKKIGIGIQIEYKEEFNEKGYQKTTSNIYSIFDYATKRSAIEVAKNEPAKKYLEPISSKGTKKERVNSNNSNTNFYGDAPPPNEDDMPF
jgi:hypothetical protein